MKINDKAGINATFAARPDLKKVHILETGAHFFNEEHAKHSGGLDPKDEKGKAFVKVKYTTLEPGAKELKEEAAA